MERFFLLLIAVVFGLLFYLLSVTLQRKFADVTDRMQQGTVMNLNDDKPGERIKTLLQKGYYFRDSLDIALIARTVEKGRTALRLDNIG